MVSENKESKKNQEKDEQCRIPDHDRLISLPDDILAHILSFLDTKSVVRTSVLSKSYRLLWTLSNCLDFSFSVNTGFRYNRGELSPDESRRLVSFKSSVNRVLQLREHSNLVKFRLSLINITSSFLEDCIQYAADHKVQHLRIRALSNTRNLVSLPKSLIDSSCLVSLDLHNAGSNTMEMPKSAKLPKLKILRLKNFKFCEQDFNGEFFLGCPNLETLVLTKCSIRPGNNLSVLVVKCLNLKNLEIRYWRSPWNCFDEQMINVHAPELTFFLFQGHLARLNFDSELPCLNEACFDLLFPTACTMVNADERKRKTMDGLIAMLLHMSKVTVLALSMRTVQVMGCCTELLWNASKIFENLRLLKLDAIAWNKYMELQRAAADTMKIIMGPLYIADEVFTFDDYEESSSQE